MVNKTSKISYGQTQELLETLESIRDRHLKSSDIFTKDFDHPKDCDKFNTCKIQARREKYGLYEKMANSSVSDVIELS